MGRRVSMAVLIVVVSSLPIYSSVSALFFRRPYVLCLVKYLCLYDRKYFSRNRCHLLNKDKGVAVL
jgi:hypothetical protein